MMIRSAAALAVLSAAGFATAGTSTVYTDLASFMAQVAPGSYSENFATVPTGAVASLNFGPVNGFAYTVGATGLGSNQLFNDPGIVSTDSALDSLLITFTGAAVTAVGGNFWASDVSFFPTGTDIVINLSDGTNVSYTSTGPTDFRGFVSDVAITSMTIDAPEGVGNAWATMDNLVVGTAIPAPGAAAVLGLAGLAGIRRRR
jgi:MYXO-CTERM domain-containing protein